MAIKDYYVVLGVPRGASTTGIRKAYREGAKKLHPDRAGAAGTRAFQEFAEAYDVLSDPARRREHDRELDAAHERSRQTARRPSPPPWSAPFVEPLAPEPREPREFVRRRERVGIPWTGSPAHLELIVTLSPREASRGGAVPVGIPVVGRCLSCRGWLLARLLCLDCSGSGVVRRVETTAVPFPPGVHSGTVLDVPVRAGGVAIRLRLRIFVA